MRPHAGFLMTNPAAAATATSKQDRVWESECVWERTRRSWRVGGCEERLPGMGVVNHVFLVDLFFETDFASNFLHQISLVLFTSGNLWGSLE